jgi:hypothetical protein
VGVEVKGVELRIKAEAKTRVIEAAKAKAGVKVEAWIKAGIMGCPEFLEGIMWLWA